MKKILCLLLLTLAFALRLSAHTGYNDTVKCPVCGNPVVFGITMSMTTFGSTLDFQKQGAIGYYYEEKINACSKCYYAGYHEDFDTLFPQPYIDSIKTVTARFQGKKIDNSLECEIAAEIKMLRKPTNDRLASIYLTASYFLRGDKEQDERRKGLQKKVLMYLEQGLKNNEYEKEQKATIHYLMGEMCRRTGDFEKAVEYFDLAIDDKNKKDWVEKTAKDQKALAKKKDDNNEI